jgi:hypothetical protein
VVIRRELKHENRRRTIILEDPDLEREIEREQGKGAAKRRAAAAEGELKAAGTESDVQAVD